MNMFSKWIVPAVVVLIFAGYLGSKTRTPSS